MENGAERVLTIFGRFVDTITDGMRLALRRVSEWASNRGFGVNPTKAKMVLFSRKY